MKTYNVGDKVKLTEEALENYGEQYSNKEFVISNVSTAYMPSAEFFSQGSPKGFHPGYDASSQSPLYDCEGLNFSLYGWEVRRA